MSSKARPNFLLLKTNRTASLQQRVLPPSNQRVPALEKEDWRDDIKPLIPGKYPGNVFKAFANHPDFFKNWMRWANHVVFKSELMQSHTRQRNLAIARTGYLKNCEYTFASYINIGAARDGKNAPSAFTAADVQAIQNGSQDSHWRSNANLSKSNDPNLDIAVLRVAEELHFDACVTEETWNMLLKSFNLKQCVDIVASCGHYTLNSYLLNSLGVQADTFKVEYTFPNFKQTAGSIVGMANGKRPTKPRIQPVDKVYTPLNINVLKTMRNHQDMNKRWSTFAQYVLSNKNNSVSRRLREIAILRTGWLCNSTYEWHQHIRMAKADCNMTMADFKAIEIGYTSPHWNDEERILLKATDELRFHCALNDEIWSEMNKYYSTKQIIDLIATVGQYTLVSYMLNSFGVQLEEDLNVTPRYDTFRPDLAM